MDKQTIPEVLNLVVRTMRTDYHSQDECTDSLTTMLTKVANLRVKLIKEKDSQRIISVLDLVTTTIATDYESPKECLKQFGVMVLEVRKLQAELRGSVYYGKDILEYLLFPNNI